MFCILIRVVGAQVLGLLNKSSGTLQIGASYVSYTSVKLKINII